MEEAALEFLSGSRRGERIALAKDRVLVGRHPSCDVALADTSVSRHHAMLHREGRGFAVEDLRSRNGTLVNGRRLAGRRALESGDELLFGEERLVFRLPPDRSVAPSPRPVDRAETGPSTADEGWIADAGEEYSIVSQLDLREPSGDGRSDASAEDRLRVLEKLERAIGSSLSLEEVLPRLLDGLFVAFPRAERGFVFLVEAETGRLLLRATKFRGRAEGGTPRLSRSVLERVVETRRAILSNDLLHDTRFADAGESIAQGWVRSVMCVPICRDDGAVVGVVQLDSARGGGVFRERELGLLAGAAGAAAQAVVQALAHDERVRQERLDRDLEIAGDVQRALLPARPPEIEGYEVFDFYEPARQVGGDYFAYVPLPDGKLAVVMADVSGKGVPAALVMAVLSGDVKYCLASETDLVAAVSRINDAFCRSGWDERFATFVAAVVDPRTHRARLVSAGHLPVFVRAPDGTVRALGPDQGGLPLGMAPEWTYRATDVDIAPGTSLVFFTDGISEAMDVAEGLFGLERVEAAVAAGGGPERIGRRILEEVERHTAGQVRGDDMCLVCLGRLEAGAAPRGGRSIRRSASRPMRSRPPSTRRAPRGGG